MRTAIAIALTLTLSTVANAQFKSQVPPKQQPAAPQAAPASGNPLQSPQAQVQQQSIDKVRRILRQDAWDLAKEGKAVFVDVRSKEQYDLGHIKGALSIPGSQLMGRLRELPPGKFIITYCACSAEQTSGRAVLELNNHGVKNAAALLGGWHEWQDNKMPSEVTKK